LEKTDENVFDKKSAASLLNVSKETIDRFRKNGKLRYRKIGDRVVFTECDLTAFLDTCITTTATQSNEKSPETHTKTGGKI